MFMDQIIFDIKPLNSKYMKSKLIILILIIPLLFSCKTRNNSENDRMNKTVMADLSGDGNDVSQNVPPPPSESNATVEKKIIKTAYLSIEVLNYQNGRKLIDSTLKLFSAYVVSENLQNTESQISNSINIKVPANQFEKLLTGLSKIAKKVDFQNVETQDVTEEYIDVQTRLTNTRKVEQTYLKLLKKTNSIEDILKIEQKLGEIRTDIESTEGRLKYLNHQVSYSSINLSVYQTVEFRYVPEKMPGFFQRLARALDMGWKGIVTFLLFLIRFWPLWLIAAAGWFGWNYWVTNRKQRRKEEKRRKKMLKKVQKEESEQIEA
jgi:hypothetical protein